MKVDYHLHLEEGPYSFRWLDRTNQALNHFHPLDEKPHTIEWIKKSEIRISNRLNKGCYSEEWLDLYLQESLTKGIKEVGIVDHLYRFHETRSYYEKYMDVTSSDLGALQQKWLDQVMTESIFDFVETINKAKERWQKKGVVLRLGIESDYFPGCEEDLKKLLSMVEWDYIIGSVHFLKGWGFDNPETQDRFESMDLLKTYEDFFEVVEMAIRSELFDFVAHLDNLKVFNHRPDEKELFPLYQKIAKALVQTDTATEINAGLFYRYPVQEMCPSPMFLSVLADHGVVFTLSSDSHFPDDLGKHVSDNLLTLKKLGYTELVTFNKRKRVMKPIQ
ncbi:histidinol phosphate phosphatase domain-containing protein [Fictibacillus nanhaiensis]|uniref:histidinol phosphate phosphatase domain-containing protein n=1 Tax=Fictibacillus nanhaiensis TaxID=742169 RepID=UPI001C93A8BB|nr:histidinol phosphate phosphatase domain-containing protein [Fictibacillus nanhaiensis]MBY6035053.1 histidinol phosphate phosphatase domain-containing protein [Fictibacillus nanhaiensis]